MERQVEGAAESRKRTRCGAGADRDRAPDYALFGDCDVVIEAATENETSSGRSSRSSARPEAEAVICSNTSSISITRLASITDRPAKFMGMHFMNPVPVMQLVELIRGIATDESTFAAVRKTLTERSARPRRSAEDFPAFIVNRILLPMLNEAVYTLYEGVGSVEAIDTAMRLGANHPMGPLELADFIGLDTCLSVMNRCCMRGWPTASTGPARCW